MDFPKTKYDEYTYGESCPPFSDNDEEDDGCVVAEYSHSDGNDPLSGQSVILNDGSSVSREEYEVLLNTVVPDTDDEQDLSKKCTRSRNRLSFSIPKEKESVACNIPDDKKVEGDDEGKDYSKAGDFEKFLGVFCPTFKDLTPRRRKRYFP